MKKILLYSLLILISLIFSGCGHSVFTSTKGIGVDVSWQPDSAIPSFRGGEYNVQNFVQRGNSTMSMTSATGGVLGTGGTSQTITVSAGTQLNESNIRKIFEDPSTPAEAKIMLAQQLGNIIQKPVPAPETSARTTYAAAASGPDAIHIRPEVTGTDKIVEKISDHAGEIKNVANNIVDTTGNVAKHTFLATLLTVKWISILMIVGIIIGIIIIIFLMVYLLRASYKYLTLYFTTRKITAKSLAGTLSITNDTNESIKKDSENSFISIDK